MPMEKWYAIQTKAKHEKNVSMLLQGKGYEQFLPLYRKWRRSAGRLHSALLPLFSGYVFCRFEVHHRLPILTTPGVFGIVSVGKAPEPIPESEIVAVRSSCASNLPLQPWPYLKEGDLVCVECGPLQGTEGIFLCEKSSGRLVLSVDMLMRSVAVEMPRDWVRPVSRKIPFAGQYS